MKQTYFEIISQFDLKVPKKVRLSGHDTRGFPTSSRAPDVLMV